MTETDSMPIYRLSPATARRINWEHIDDIAVAVAPDRGGASAASALPDPERIRAAFAVAKEEFGTALGGTRRVMRFAITLQVLAMAVTIAGLFLVRLTPWGGSAISAAGLASLFGFFNKTWLLARDEGMLVTILTRYELAILLSPSPQLAAKFLQEFLRETYHLRK